MEMAVMTSTAFLSISLTLTSNDFMLMMIAVISFLSTSLLRVINLKLCRSALNTG